MKRKATKKRRRSRDQIVTQWGKQASWLTATIVNLHNSPTGHGLKWTAKMVAHYKRQYDALRRITPKMCEGQALDYDTKISDIIEYYTDHL